MSRILLPLLVIVTTFGVGLGQPADETQVSKLKSSYDAIWQQAVKDQGQRALWGSMARWVELRPAL
jgi:hypothetical protein